METLKKQMATMMAFMQQLQLQPAAAGPAPMHGDEDEEKVTHVAMKNVGYTAGNRVTVNVAVFTDAERRQHNKWFKASEAAAKQTHTTNKNGSRMDVSAFRRDDLIGSKEHTTLCNHPCCFALSHLGRDNPIAAQSTHANRRRGALRQPKKALALILGI